MPLFLLLILQMYYAYSHIEDQKFPSIQEEMGYNCSNYHQGNKHYCIYIDSTFLYYIDHHKTIIINIYITNPTYKFKIQ